MFRKYQNMFLPAANYIEEAPPMSTHPTLQAQWKDEFYEAPFSEAEEKVCDLIVQGLTCFLETATNKRWRQLTEEQKTEHVKALLEKPQIPQRTPEWYAQASSVLTASEFSSLYSSERQYANLVIAKAIPPLPRLTNRLACPTNEMSPFDWGIRFEPVVKQIFQRRWSVKIVDSGRIMHPTDTHLAASPDGFLLEGGTRTGRLIEIKCPITREIGGAIPFDYWCQMQIQMEVTGIDECEYLEVKLDSASPKKKYVPENPMEEGLMWLLKKERSDSTVEYVYAYTPEEFDKLEAEGWDLHEAIPWALESFHTVTLQRDPKWFADTSGMREKFWRDVAKARAGSFKAPAPFTPRPKACLIQDSPPDTETPRAMPDSQA
jgi:hypothetical protein